MTIKNTCSKCDELNDRPGQRYCKSCHAEYMRKNRPTYSELTEEQRKKSICRSYSKILVRRGKLIKQPCKCGDEDTEVHHHDYDKPKEVEWLCRACHLELHRKLTEAA